MRIRLAFAADRRVIYGESNEVLNFEVYFLNKLRISPLGRIARGIESCPLRKMEMSEEATKFRQ
jgi:hypothetical protein